MSLIILRSSGAQRTRLLLLMLLVFGGSIFGLTGANAATAGPIQKASDDTGDAIAPKVAQDPQGNVHIVWDSNEGSRVVRYTKGTYNASSNSYSYSPSVELADVGSFQYSTPSIAVAPDGTVLAAWSDGNLRIKTWKASERPSSGSGTSLGSGIQPTVAVDGNSNFHLAWNGDFQVQYCQWNGSSCVKRDALLLEESNRPDIAVDSSNNVHIVADSGQTTRYIARKADQNWGSTQTLGSGNFAQIASDGQGNVHIVRSTGFNIEYCSKTIDTACADNRRFSFADDLQPSIGVTRAGQILVVFRDAKFARLIYNTRENGTWSGSTELADSTTQPDVTARPYFGRFSVVWSRDFAIQQVSLKITEDGRCAPALDATARPRLIQNPRTIMYFPVLVKSPPEPVLPPC